jgi:large subunit ribosomal protein L18
MDVSKRKHALRVSRKARIRNKVSGTDTRPRMCVYRSNKYLYVQVVSDESGRTLASASSIKGGGAGVNLDKAKKLGSDIAEKCKTAGIDNVVFDRGGYRYHGRIKALADAAREGGLRF